MPGTGETNVDHALCGAKSDADLSDEGRQSGHGHGTIGLADSGTGLRLLPEAVSGDSDGQWLCVQAHQRNGVHCGWTKADKDLLP